MRGKDKEEISTLTKDNSSNEFTLPFFKGTQSHGNSTFLEKRVH